MKTAGDAEGFEDWEDNVPIVIRAGVVVGTLRLRSEDLSVS